MACPPAQMAVEQAYLGRLPQVTAFAIDGTTLAMTDDQDKTILRYVATEGSEAIQGDWEVTSYHGHRHHFGARRRHHDRQVRGRHGQRQHGLQQLQRPVRDRRAEHHHRPAGVDPGRLSDPELSTQETNYLNALQLAKTFQVTGDQLGLFREGGTTR